MALFYEVLMDTGKILALVLVSLAFCISGLILFRPTWASALNRKFNTLYSTDHVMKKMDHSISTTEQFLKNRILLGTLFFLGSVFVAWYSLTSLDIHRFIAYVIQPKSYYGKLTSEILMVSLKWLFVIFGFIGTFCSVTIIASPDTFRKFNDQMDRLFSTDETMKSLEDMHSTLDSWVIRHNVLVGSFLFIGSIFLIVVCLKAFLG